MSFDANRLYELLPAIYRVRDAKQGEPLKALLALIAEQVAVLEENLEQSYDDHFIETCAEWVVPYIGDLVGARGIYTFADAGFSQRVQVANTIAYRRRKGTATVLEQIARDVTDWDASVVEYFERLATTQYLNHLRPWNLAFMSLRDSVTISYQTKVEFGRLSERTIEIPNWENLEYVNTPFDRMARTAEVRRIEPRRGKYNIPNIGIHLWRVQSFPVRSATAFQIDSRRYRFDPLGRDLPLFNQVETETEISHLAEPVNVPMALSRRVLRENFATYYGEDKSVLVEPQPMPSTSPPGAIKICDLRDVTDGAGNVIGWAHMPTDHVAIDPVLGRIALPDDATKVVVDYHYGFVARMGGGTYGRAATLSTELAPLVRVPSDQPTIQAALNAVAATGGVVEIEPNDIFHEALSLTLSTGVEVELRAADEHRPVLFLHGDMTISGGADSTFIINGLWIAGGDVRVPAADGNALAGLILRHCTLAPSATPAPGDTSPPGAFLRPVQLLVEAANVSLQIEQSIIGVVRVSAAAEASISDSILDAGASTATAYMGADLEAAGSPPALTHGGPLTMRNSTVIGRVRTDVMNLASNTLFFARSVSDEAPVESRRLQEGCVRFSFVPLRSLLPRKYHCQPDHALLTLAKELGFTSASDLSAADRDRIVARVKPVFTSLRFGNQAYAQLSLLCPEEIREGADDEAEMGACHSLYQPQREANLSTRLSEYLRFGLEAGILYTT